MTGPDADRRSVDEMIDALGRSPMFQLSLASKELFHSNFLSLHITKEV
jgi:hypothetical protein